ncbi:MAG: hypothetical protein ACYTBX_18525 [Planctomycetota bacterium]|jgi:hypothetical protein
METAKRTLILLSLVILTAGTAQSDEKPATEEVPRIYTESCVVKITSDPAILPDMIATIESLLQSSGVSGKAVREIIGTPLNISPQKLCSLNTRLLSARSLDTIDTIVLSVQVNLPEQFKAKVNKFMNSLINNLRKTLDKACFDFTCQLKNEIEEVEGRQKEAQFQLSKIMEQARAIEPAPPIEQNPADMFVYEHLDQIVDLSQLSPTMPFSEAIEILKNSVDPPLNIVVLWRELLDNAEIERGTEINMDGMHQVRLGTALELLLKAVAGNVADLVYVVNDGVITIATIESLPNWMETQIYDIPGFFHPAGDADNLVQLIQDTIEPDSWFETSETGEGTIRSYMGKKLVVLQTPEIHQKIQKFLRETKVDVPIDIPLDIPVQMLRAGKLDLLRDKLGLEMDVARLEAIHLAIEEQIVRISEQATVKIKDDTVAAEMRGIVEMYAKRLEEIRKQVEAGRETSDEVVFTKEKLAEAKMDLAKRLEELSKSTGSQLASFNSELADKMIELAEKKAEFRVVDKQLKQTESQIIMATTLDPQLSQIRRAKQALEDANKRLNELKIRLANLQPPTVTVLGAD